MTNWDCSPAMENWHYPFTSLLIGTNVSAEVSFTLSSIWIALVVKSCFKSNFLWKYHTIWQSIFIPKHILSVVNWLLDTYTHAPQSPHLSAPVMAMWNNYQMAQIPDPNHPQNSLFLGPWLMCVPQLRPCIGCCETRTQPKFNASVKTWFFLWYTGVFCPFVHFFKIVYVCAARCMLVNQHSHCCPGQKDLLLVCFMHGWIRVDRSS